MFGDRATLYHRTETGETERWERHGLSGVYLENRGGVRFRADGETSRSECLLIVPKAAFPGFEEAARPGDKLVPGQCTREIVSSPSELSSARWEVLTITSIRFLGGKGELAHWEVRCNEYRR